MEHLSSFTEKKPKVIIYERLLIPLLITALRFDTAFDTAFQASIPGQYPELEEAELRASSSNLLRDVYDNIEFELDTYRRSKQTIVRVVARG